MFSMITALMFACSGTNNTSTTTVDSPVPPANASPSVEVPGVVATWNGGTLNYEEGTKAVKGQLIQLEAEYLTNTYQTAMQGIEQAIFEKSWKKKSKLVGTILKKRCSKQKSKTKWVKPLQKRSLKCTSSSSLVWKA